jgi:hypothetical protein
MSALHYFVYSFVTNSFLGLEWSSCVMFCLDWDLVHLLL